MFSLIFIFYFVSIANSSNFANLSFGFDNKSVVKREANVECGIPLESSGYISGGQQVKRGDFPWLVAIWLQEENKQPEYICGGSLISARKVVTAAHCLRNKDERSSTKPKDLLLMLGAHNLFNYFEPDRIQVVPSEVKVHEDWNPFVQRFNDDIALITLENDVTFTKYIKPICLLNQNANYPVKEGFVVGWGVSGSSAKHHENIPRLLKIPIATSNEECYRENHILATIGSQNSFCAGKRGVGVCLGDSGSGFSVKIGGRFYLKGFVSSSLKGEGGCYTENYAIYTDVTKYTNWVQPVRPTHGRSQVAPRITCGVMSSTTGLVAGGNLASREQFPWVVSILWNINGRTKYFGAGSLVSDRHIVASASSVAFPDTNTNQYRVYSFREGLKLIFGSTLSYSGAEMGAVVKSGNTDVARINVHPLVEFGLSSVSDIAVIVLKVPISSSRYISPVCIWIFGTRIDIGNTVYGVGFGSDHNNELSNVKKYAAMTIDFQARCKQFYEKFPNARGNKSEYFCASGRNGNVANQFDDPLYMKVNGKWYLRALQVTFWEGSNGKIDTSSPLLYENIPLYSKWIEDQLKY